MKPEAINRAIAEACGTHKILINEPDHVEVQDRDGLVAVYEGEGSSMSPLYTQPANYHGSLDAMHEAEKVLDEDQQYSYEYYLDIYSTAAQRAEAFLRTLNLWKP